MAGKFRRIGPGCYHTRRLSSGYEGDTGGDTSADSEYSDIDWGVVNPQNFDSHIIERICPPEIVRPEILARLKHLTGRERAIVLIHFYGGMTLGEIGKEFGISKQRVNKIIQQARDKSMKLKGGG